MSANSAIDRLFDQAIDFHQQGQLDQARTLYEKILVATPDSADATHNLGLVLQQQGILDKASALLQKANRLNPHDPVYLNSLAGIYRDQNDFSQAITIYRQAIKHNDSIAALHNNLGIALQASDQHALAIKSFEKALVLHPNYAEAHNNLGISLSSTAQLSSATGHFRRAIDLKPDYAHAMANLANALSRMGQFAKAVDFFRAALTQVNDPNLHFGLGCAQFELSQYEAALTSFDATLAINPAHIAAMDKRAETLIVQNKGDAAIAMLNAAVELAPDNAELMLHLGTALAQLGRTKQAATALRQTIAIDPDFGVAHYLLARGNRHLVETDDTRAAHDAFSRSAPGSENRMNLGFALGKIEEDLGNYAGAITFLHEANAIKRARFTYDWHIHAQRFEKLKQLYTPRFFEARSTSGCKDRAPIFIVGMPRSGTSLVEQILASHNRVDGAGELTLIESIANAAEIITPNDDSQSLIVHASAGQLKSLGESYLTALRNLSRAPRVTDKLPGNFWHIGIIHAILPNAKIINCRRDPADNCFAIYKTLFAAEGHHYAYDLAELGYYYSIYNDMMTHWHNVLPSIIHDIDYEKLVTDQEGETRKLLDYCALDWDDNCLSFHKTSRAVRTASDHQVRQPIYQSSIKLSERYGTALQPLLDALAQKP